MSKNPYFILFMFLIKNYLISINGKWRSSLDLNMNCYMILMHSFSTINTGQCCENSEAMQVVYGTYVFEVVFYEAPNSAIIAQEMETFLNWFSNDNLSHLNKISKAIVKSAILMLNFESIHPFKMYMAEVVEQ